jgi:NH3-dependent NAD+ synthetase
VTTELLARLAGRRVVASVSGGKDSAALSLQPQPSGEKRGPALRVRREDVTNIADPVGEIPATSRVGQPDVLRAAARTAGAKPVDPKLGTDE